MLLLESSKDIIRQVGVLIKFRAEIIRTGDETSCSGIRKLFSSL
jgi:hypothetical protein